MRVTTESLPGSHFREIEITHLETDLPAKEDQLERVILANGYLEDRNSHLASASAMVATAQAEGQPFRVSLHDSPLSGRNTYGLANRTELYSRVVAHVSHRGDMPVRLVGHSWGMPQIIDVGSQYVSDGKPVESVVGSNPNGLTPIALGPRSIIRMLQAGVREMRLQETLETGYIMSDAANTVGLKDKMRIHVQRNLAAAAMEGVGLLTDNFVDEAVALHGKLSSLDGASRMRILAGSQDGLCPSSEMRYNLLAAGYPEEDFIELDTFHGGPLVDPRLAPEVYQAVMLKPVDK